jgi:DNA-binding NarL/FixJ family response regulator
MGRGAKKILIVDDQPAVRRAVIRMLESVPEFEVCGEAENGAAAIDQAIQLRPDLVVLDCSMPVMNGLEASRILRGLMPGLPILMYTAYANARLTDEAIAAGANKVATKSNGPALIHDLQTLLEHAA